jgi:hypothetical protein
MTLTRDQLFADLDALTVEQIEAGLAAGVWGDDGRATVEHYILKRKFAADQRNAVVTAQQAAKVAMDQAASAKLWAIAAFIIAAGAMVAAMAAGLIAFLAVRGFSLNTLW